jgi:hypothetical protein
VQGTHWTMRYCTTCGEEPDSFSSCLSVLSVRCLSLLMEEEGLMVHASSFLRCTLSRGLERSSLSSLQVASIRNPGFGPARGVFSWGVTEHNNQASLECSGSTEQRQLTATGPALTGTFLVGGTLSSSDDSEDDDGICVGK